jgi:hypothetical protein
MPYLDSIQHEYQRYKRIAEGAVDQICDDDLTRTAGNDTNSSSIIICHLAGNLKSRFTDFLTTDGEKPWHHRDREFDEQSLHSDELMQRWEEGWAILFATLDSLSPDDLEKTITIRNKPLSVVEALNRSLAHVADHVGQVTLLARTMSVPIRLSLFDS